MVQTASPPVGRPTALRQSTGEPRTLADLPSHLARQFGDRPALLIKPGFRTRVTTYQQLDELASRAARLLQERGVRKGDRVLLWAPNMPQWVGLFFGCHKAGAVLVPLDVRSSPDFAATIIAKTQPKIAFISRVTAKLMAEMHSTESPAPFDDAQGRLRQAEGERTGVPSVMLEQLEARLPADTELLEEVSVEPGDLAEIMFTSGTTGDPKGVMLTHRNIVSNVMGAHEVLPTSPSFRLLSLLPLSHMFEQCTGLLAPLYGGARIVYPVSRQPSILYRAFAENHITMICLIPQALQIFLSGIEREARRQGKGALLARLFKIAERLPRPLRRLAFRSVHTRFGGKLDTIVCGGAYLDPALAHQWELMGIDVYQGYGATEASPIITGDRPTARKLGAVGKAFPGVEVRIGQDGEVLASGPNIFQGYWGNPEATAAVLKDGWYHTGDLGSLDDESFLHLKGRIKDLIVLSSGMNVYPDDIEPLLARQPGVQDAVVVGLERERGEVEVHAALLMSDPESADEAVRQANERLADHQRVQGHTVWPEEDFPRTHTLKVKKGEVLQYLKSAQASAEPSAPPSAAAPTNVLHRLITDLSSAAAEQIRPDSTLGDDLGLDSLGRVELLSGIESEMGAFVDEQHVSAATTVAQLEELIASAQQRGAASDFVGWPLNRIVGVLREIVLQGLIFPAYHLFWRIKVEGKERLDSVKGPVIVAANHHFAAGKYGVDPGVAWMALPTHLRRRICTAGEEHAVFEPRLGGTFARLVNAFPISKEGNVRGSLEYIGRLLDGGWSVLIFPEGTLFDGGPMRPFMGGTGLLAVESATPVVPIWIEIERRSALQGHNPSWRGALTVRVGDPITFPPGASYVEATQRLEDAIRALSGSGGAHPSGSYAAIPA